MDPNIGSIERGEILIEDGRIAAISESVGNVDAEIIDASRKIVLPGLVDTHRHLWQTQLRALCADWTLSDYHKTIRGTVSPCYEAEDVAIGNHLGAVEAIDAGVTTVLDFSHCMNTPEHADAAIDGLVSAGIRSLFCYGFFRPPDTEGELASLEGRLANFERIRRSRTWSDGLLSLGVALTETRYANVEQISREIQAARANGDRIAVHTGAAWNIPTGIRELADANLLGPDQVHIHCNALGDEEWALFQSAGVHISSSPETELNMGMGRLPIGKAVDHGLIPSLSCDIISLNRGDLFGQMRLALAHERFVSNEPLNEAGQMPEALRFTALDALTWATMNGAVACGLDERIGSLTPGKDADLIMLGGESFGMSTIVNPVGASVFQATPQDVTDVMIAGEVMKRDGDLLVADLAGLRSRAETSAEAVLTRVDARYPASLAASVSRLSWARTPA